MIVLILILAVGLRLISLNQSVWLDEATQILASRDRTFTELITQYSVGDFHPPLYHAFLWLWFRIVPATEIMARVPSVFFGIITVWLTFRLGLCINRKVATFASLLLAVAPLHIYYSQEARMYSLASLLATLSMLAFVHITKKQNWQWWVLYTAATGVLLWMEYIPYFLLCAQGAYLVVQRHALARGIFKSMIVVWAGIGIVLLPWFPYFREQLMIGRTFAQTVPAWGHVVGGIEAKTLPLTLAKFVFGRLSVPDNWLVFMIMGLILILFCTVLFVGLKRKIPLWVPLWLLVPIAFGLLVALWTPIFSYFRFLYVLPALYLLYAYGALAVPSRLRLLAVVFGISTTLGSSALYLFMQEFHREDWRSASAFMDGKGVPVGFYLHIPPDPYRYYSQNNGLGIGLLAGSARVPDAQVEDAVSKLTSADSFLVSSYLRDISDPDGIIVRMIKNRGFEMTESRSFRGIGTIDTYMRP